MIRSILALCKVQEVQCVNTENVLKMGVKDVIAKHLVSALQMIERQHMLIINQRDPNTTNFYDLNSAKRDIIRLQKEVIRLQGRSPGCQKLSMLTSMNKSLTDCQLPSKALWKLVSEDI